MINLRYHIVSITAVFLALGIGLTLGSTFLDRVTVDTLKNQLDTVQARVEETQAANEELERRAGALEERSGDFADEISERVLEGHLTDVPVLVVATEGTDEALVEQAIGALVGAGADVSGTWWLTERWLLDDAEEVDQLADVLDLRSDDVDRLRRNSAIRVAELLADASQPAATDEGDAVGGPEDAGGAEGEVDTGETTVPETPAGPTEPELVAALQGAGFIDYAPVAGAEGDRVLLPAAGARYLVISGAQPDSGPQLMALGLIEEMAADGPAPLVAAQAQVDLRDDDGGSAPEDDRRTTFVGPLRDGELTGDRVSTVDDLDTAAGLVATVLALEDLAHDQLGHYGVAAGASRLLPGTDPGP